MEATAKTQKPNEDVTVAIAKGNIVMKTCRCCGKLLPLTAFSKNKSCRDGHANTCNSCKYKNKKAAAALRKAGAPTLVFDIKSLPDNVIAEELIRRGWKGQLSKSVTLAL